MQNEFRSISVVIPTYNHAADLRRCLELLFAQQYPREHYEVIVVDDGSIDASHDIFQEMERRSNRPALRCFSQQHAGPATARNRGIAEAANTIIAFTDDDCLPTPDWLETINQYFEQNPGLLCVGGVMYSPKKYIRPFAHHAPPKEIAIRYAAGFPGTNNVAYTKDILQKVGGFDESFRDAFSTEDVDLYIRVKKHGKTIFDRQFLMQHGARPISIRSLVNGYGKFHEAYLALQKRYPEDFTEIYGQPDPQKKIFQELFTTGARWKLRYYAPYLLNPIVLVKCIVTVCWISYRVVRNGFQKRSV